jgi:hypothetical protein
MEEFLDVPLFSVIHLDDRSESRGKPCQKLSSARFAPSIPGVWIMAKGPVDVAFDVL